MIEVTITRTTNQYRRSINGAWVGGGSQANSFQADESILCPKKLPNGMKLEFSLNSGIQVTWPDGKQESAFPFNGGAFPGYPPICIPANGRLAALLNSEPA